MTAFIIILTTAALAYGVHRWEQWLIRSKRSAATLQKEMAAKLITAEFLQDQARANMGVKDVDQNTGFQ